MRYAGNIGYMVLENPEPGIWTEDDIVEIFYKGDLVRNNKKNQAADGVNDNINISNEISIIADPYAMENFFNIVYAEFAGNKWKVTNVTIQYPRLILSLGGVWNGRTGTDRESEEKAADFAREHM